MVRKLHSAARPRLVCRSRDAPPHPEMSRYTFTLFVAGETPRSQSAIACLRRLCRERLEGACDVSVVDVTRDPAAAETRRILTTPTLIRESPGSARRVTGDLLDADRVLRGLGIFAPGDNSATPHGP